MKEVIPGTPAWLSRKLANHAPSSSSILLLLLLFWFFLVHILCPPSHTRLFIQDLLIEIAGVSVLQASLEDAAKLLKGAGDVVR